MIVADGGAAATMIRRPRALRVYDLMPLYLLLILRTPLIKLRLRRIICCLRDDTASAIIALHMLPPHHVWALLLILFAKFYSISLTRTAC